MSDVSPQLRGNWLAVYRGKDTSALRSDHPKSFLLLSLIAERARYSEEGDSLTGVMVGEAAIGDYKAAGLRTEGEYRHALRQLKSAGLIATRSTNKGTIAKLIDARIFDPFRAADGAKNTKINNDQRNDQRNGHNNDHNNDQANTVTPLELNTSELQTLTNNGHNNDHNNDQRNDHNNDKQEGIRNKELLRQKKPTQMLTIEQQKIWDYYGHTRKKWEPKHLARWRKLEKERGDDLPAEVDQVLAYERQQGEYAVRSFYTLIDPDKWVEKLFASKLKPAQDKPKRPKIG
tara:strand:+ start:4164 stop:5030 length:867 start_codon:yes stop_codon:yes gene_type:complete